MTNARKPCAIYVITKHGYQHGRKLKDAWPEADLYVSAKVAPEGATDIIRCSLPLTPLLTAEFTHYDCHIFVISVGAVVRMVAPFLVDKKVDPAVVCVDDVGRFAIALLSGHVGRGNEWTDRVAAVLGAQAVITTASDVQGTLTVDILGRAQGWTLDDHDRLVTLGCAAVVNERPVLIVQETGEPNFWPLERAWPPGVHYRRDWEGIDLAAWEMLLVVSDRDVRRLYPDAYAKSIIYRPKSLILGVGCDRGIPLEVLERGIQQTLDEFQLSWKSVAGIASIDLKADEEGLLALCAKHRWSFTVYPAEELDAVRGIVSPSERVKGFTGTRSVSEAACLKAAEASELLVSKQKYRESETPQAMTVAIARRSYAVRAK